MINTTEVLTKLNAFYDKEQALQNNIRAAMAELQQVQEDIEMLQTMIMYAANRQARTKEFVEAEGNWERLRNG